MQVSFGDDNVFTVDLVGQSGGLACMDDPSVFILYADSHMIDIETRFEGHEIFMTFVYGNLVVRHRDQVWERLSRMSTTRIKPWFMIAEFNELRESMRRGEEDIV